LSEIICGQIINKYLYKFTNDKLDLYDKLVLPILKYGDQIRGVIEGKSIERVHLHFYKRY